MTIKYFILFFFISITFTIKLLADSCSEVTPLTCSQGELFDGTGSKKIAGFLDDKMKDHLAEVSKESEAKFHELIDNKKINNYEMEIALSATGQGVTEECNSFKVDKSLTELCQKNLARALSERVISKLTAPRQEFPRGELEDEVKLRETAFFESVYDPIQKKLTTKLGLPEASAHLAENVFPKVKEKIINIIDRSVPNEKHKQMMKEKINAIRFGGMDCDAEQGLSSEFTTNAVYIDQSNKFYFCKGFERYGRSDFTAANVIGHEMGHAIDPCVIQKGAATFSFKYSSAKEAEKEYPFPNLVSCLRNKKSIAAKNFNDYKTADYSEYDDDYARQHLAHKSKLNHKKTVNSSDETHADKDFFCEKDQIGESFSDWLGTEVIAEYLNNEWKDLKPLQVKNGLANTWRDACTPGLGLHNVKSKDVHPPTRDRLEKIIMVHPTVRARLDCPPLNKMTMYCDLKAVKYDYHDEGSEKYEEEMARSVNSLGREVDVLKVLVKVGEVENTFFYNKKSAQLNYFKFNKSSKLKSLNKIDKKYIDGKIRDLASIKVNDGVSCPAYISVIDNVKKYSKCINKNDANTKKLVKFVNTLALAIN